MVKIPFIKLSDLNRRIHHALEAEFGDKTFWIIADVTSHTYKNETQQHYFELVEKDKFSSKIVAKIAGRAWGTASASIRNFEKLTGQTFNNNINVLINVTVQYHPLYGLQLSMIDIDVNFTLGQFEQQRNATLAKLLSQNPTFISRINGQFVTRNNTLVLNKVLQRIAIITSETSAGYQDFSPTLSNNSFNYKFLIRPFFTKVQGEDNARSLVEKLVEVYYEKGSFDAVVIIRGGGAQSDFLIFDNYELSRAVAKFPIPVITGIGHQKNESIVDLMAHTATKTPTKVAEHIIAHNRMFEEGLFVFRQIIVVRSQQRFLQQHKELNQLKAGLINNVLHLIKRHQQQVMSYTGIFVNRPNMFLIHRQKALVRTFETIKSRQQQFIRIKDADLSHYMTLIRMMSPKNLLKKGFAILKLNGRIISTADSVRNGDELSVHLSNTELKTIVKSKTDYHGNEYDI